MRKLKLWLEGVYERRICNELDNIVLVIGDEGMGKSTLICFLEVLYQDVRGQERDVEAILDSMTYDRETFKNAVAKKPPRSAIAVPDAARVLYKKEAMVGDQRELHKDMLDMRVKEHLILLGFQAYDDVPTFLAKRRAQHALFIPKRGLVRGFSRSKLDEKYQMANKDRDAWPSADLKSTFPSLEGTELWRRYREQDREKKFERISEEDVEDEQPSKNEHVKQVAQEIKDEGVHGYVSLNSSNKTPYLNADLIEVRHDLSIREAKKVKSLLEADPDVIIDSEVAGA